MRIVTAWVTLAASGGLAAAQPAPAPQPQSQPQPSAPPQPQPYPTTGQPTPQPYPQQYPPPYPQQYPQPYPAQPYYYPPQPYAPQPYTPAQEGNGRRIHDGEVIADFAAVGTLASIDILIRQDVHNGSAGTFILLGGLFGGGAGGYLLTQKYQVDGGAAHATTIGLIAGAANGALLIQPMLAPNYDAEDVMALIFFGSAIGTGAGFAYGQAADLTEGQSTFLGTGVLLGSSTAALAAIAGSRDGEYGNWESGTLALGLDAGLVGGALIAPSLNWSKKRSRIVLASTVAGALVGGMAVGLTTNNKRDQTGEHDYNGDLIAGCMTAGLWGGFGLGILVTRDYEPDPKYVNGAKSTTPNGPATSTSIAPFVAEHSAGVMAGGTW